MYFIPEISYKNYLTHKVKKGDTLISLSEELKIDSYSLRAYHNRYCPLEDLIEKNLPGHLEFIIIESPEEKHLRESHRKKVVFSNKDFKLPFNPSGFQKVLFVLYTIENGADKTSLKEEISVKWLSTGPNGYSLFEINRISKIYVDDIADKIMADELAEMAASVLYPLQVVIDPDGLMDRYS